MSVTRIDATSVLYRGSFNVVSYDLYRDLGVNPISPAGTPIGIYPLYSILTVSGPFGYPIISDAVNIGEDFLAVFGPGVEFLGQGDGFTRLEIFFDQEYLTNWNYPGGPDNHGNSRLWVSGSFLGNIPNSIGGTSQLTQAPEPQSLILIALLVGCLLFARAGLKPSDSANDASALSLSSSSEGV
jgi:hypothetical protein